MHRPAHNAVSRLAALCADAQYWGRYGRCIVKGYRSISTAPKSRFYDYYVLGASSTRENSVLIILTANIIYHLPTTSVAMSRFIQLHAGTAVSLGT